LLERPPKGIRFTERPGKFADRLEDEKKIEEEREF
jgi:hypothetical protein